MKKLTAALLSLLLCVGTVCAVPAFAASSSSASSQAQTASAASTAKGTAFTLKDTYLKMTIPDGLYAFTQDTAVGDENLAKAGIADWLTEKKTMQDRNTVLMVCAPQRLYTLNLGQKSSSTTQKYYNMKTMSDADLKSLMDDLSKPQSSATGDAASIKTNAKRYTNAAGVPFFYMEMSGTLEGKSVREVAYFTIINGAGYTFETYKENAKLTAAQTASLKELVDSLQVTKYTQKPAEDTTSPVKAIFLLLSPLLLIVVLVLGGYIFSRVRRSRENQRKALLLERMTAYRKHQEALAAQAQEQGGPLEEPETLIENTTKCVKKTLKRFSWMDLLLNRKGTWISMLVLAVILIIGAVIAANTAAKVVAVLCAAFCIAHPLLIPRKVFQAEDGNFRKRKSRRVHYQFREEDFRVSGVYSGVYPYAQIIHVYEVERYFYLYLGANHVYIVNKHSFTKGTEDDLRKLLKEKCLGYKTH
ncbi:MULTISPECIES: YcxB family protein [Caproicibacterium]|uniref:YcxB family protein n=1 Tax=Caproicibacterium argilliputei TaxID=3030016 RepID=A0AA97D8H0_9FIRM|nr:YcxB family protein [Caproicibacterium argilliputei]WOC31229.1 YcxB family protein [Caproicibacterium argilliputei]